MGISVVQRHLSYKHIFFTLFKNTTAKSTRSIYSSHATYIMSFYSQQ